MKRLFPLRLLLAAIACSASAQAMDLGKIQLPAGFSIAIFADRVANARSMTLGARGTVFVGTRSAGKVHALVDQDQDGMAEKSYEIANGLEMPNGVAFFGGALYVAENHRILRFDDIEEKLASPPIPVVITALPDRRHHGWRYLRVGPDGKLYVAIGAPCNICDEEGFAVILRMNPDGTGREVYARGVRNSVGFDWAPGSNVLWFTDNGRDWLGDDSPADELNSAPTGNMHFGYPYCHAGDIPDPEFGSQRSCSEFVAPVQKLGAHVAPLGLRFYTGPQFPAPYRGNLFIAEHGSWNRTTPVGYRISLVTIEGAGGPRYSTFASGWLGEGGKAWGRPVDLLVMPDGALLVSDDKAGMIYRISYNADSSGTAK